MNAEPEQPDVEREKLAIERDKLVVEREKLALEAKKARWTAIGVGVPICVALVTVAFGFWSALKQAELQFQLEVAKSVMSSATLGEALDRAEVYRKMFPGIPANFGKAIGESIDPATGPKKAFIQQMIDARATPHQVLLLYRAMWSDEWMQNSAFDNILRDTNSTSVPSTDR
jgi:hypothetical protein